MSTPESFDAAVRRHDADLHARGLQIWVGAEPTFTDRTAQSPEWLHAALGGAKENRARSLLAVLNAQWPGGVVLRCEGRRYPGESRPRWSFGLFRRRDGEPVWRGPPDPLPPVAGHEDRADADVPVSTTGADEAVATAGSVPSDDVAAVDAFALALADRLDARGWTVARGEPSRAARPGLVLDLARADREPCRLAVELDDAGERPCLRVELPALRTPAQWLDLLGAAEQAARSCGLAHLVIGGPPPPVDATVELTTVTPDPAVIEVNSAPCATASAFLRQSRTIYAAAAAVGLAPLRLYFNGGIADSGGGGQITLGGPSPQASPFVQVPHLLPHLVRWFIAHPSLSYLFAHDFLGPSGQSVRADERGPVAFDELRLALSLLEREPALTAARAWQTLAPFLSDAAGNLHRADINVEKLCNPHLPARGELGLVEFRSLRMQHSPERATALACLLRAAVAMLMHEAGAPPLIDWGRDLHERFALPFFLAQDLEQVLAALRRAGLGLGAPIENILRGDEFLLWAAVPVPGAVLEVRRAIEFWPLLGDAASEEQSGTSRLVDASTTRVELRLRPLAPAGPAQGIGAADADPAPEDWRSWRVAVAGRALPLRFESDGAGECLVYGLRYRRYAPTTGLHPGLGAQAPVILELSHAELAHGYAITLHEWRPDGEAYPGLPSDLADARHRLAERVTRQVVAPAEPIDRLGLKGECAQVLPGIGSYCADLRFF